MQTDVTRAEQVGRLIDDAVHSELPLSVTEPEIAKRIGEFYEAHAIPAETFARVVAFAIVNGPFLMARVYRRGAAAVSGVADDQKPPTEALP